MTNFIYLFLASVPILIAGDLLWLGVIAKSLYQSQLSHLLGPVNWYGAIAFYFIYSLGLTYFASYAGFNAGDIWKAALLGAAFGFFAYATYDLTNLATLKDWPLSVTIIDMLWGAFLSAVVSSAAVAILLQFAK